MVSAILRIRLDPRFPRHDRLVILQLVGLPGGVVEPPSRRVVENLRRRLRLDDLTARRLVDCLPRHEAAERQRQHRRRRVAHHRHAPLSFDALQDRAPLPRPERLRLLVLARREAAHFALPALVARRALASLREVHHYRHRLAGLRVVGLEQIGFTVMLLHRYLPRSAMPQALCVPCGWRGTDARAPCPRAGQGDRRSPRAKDSRSGGGGRSTAAATTTVFPRVEWPRGKTVVVAA